MSTREHPVTVAVERPDGSVEHVRVGTAIAEGDGFRLKLGDLRIGAGTPASPYSSYTPPRRAQAPGEVTTLPNYGRSKGAPIRGASVEDLEYYANGARRTLNDPSKSRWHDKERALLAAIEAELARQSGQPADEPASGSSVAPPDEPEPPPHTDDDIPF